MNSLEELKYALDATWRKHPEFADVLNDKTDFYKFALDKIETILKSKNNSIDNLKFISEVDEYNNKLRYKIYENTFNPNYLNELYQLSMKGKATYINYVPTYDDMKDSILMELKEIEKNENKRSFYKESKEIDDVLNKISPKYRKKFLNNAIYNNAEFNIHYKKEDLNKIASINKDNIKLILTDNAYRIYVTINTRTYPENINMLSWNGNFKEYQFYSNLLNDIMSNIDDVSLFVSNMDSKMLDFLSDVYLMSLNVRQNTNYIHFANTINDPLYNNNEIFEQLESRNTLNKINENSGYSM